MSCDTGAKTGAELEVSFAIGCASDDPKSLSFLSVGMARSKSFSTSIDTIDVTADKSLGDRRQFIPSYKTDTVDMDGISYPEEIYNQLALRNHIKFGNPADAVGGKPFVWLMFIHPVYQQVEYYPMIASNWDDNGSYDDSVQWSASFTSAGAPSFEAVTP
jgi:predicted secreted protein